MVDKRKQIDIEKNIDDGFGMAKHFKEPFKRDKKTRDFD